MIWLAVCAVTLTIMVTFAAGMRTATMLHRGRRTGGPVSAEAERLKRDLLAIRAEWEEYGALLGRRAERHGWVP